MSIGPDLLISLGLNILAIIAPVMVGYIISLTRAKIGSERYRQVRILARDTVHYVEQVYQDLDGEAKYKYAVEWLAAQAREGGMELSTKQICAFIESAVYSMKNITPQS